MPDGRPSAEPGGGRAAVPRSGAALIPYTAGFGNVFDAGYDVSRLAHQLTGLPVELVADCGRTGCCISLRRQGPVAGGGPPGTDRSSRLRTRRPGPGRRSRPAPQPGPPRYGTAVAAAWDRLHPRLTHRGAWLGHDGKLPIIEGTLIRLQVDHLPGDRDPKPVWLWSSRTRSAPGRDHGPTAGRVLPGVAARTCSSRRPAGGPGLSARPGTRAAGPATTGARRPATTQPGRRVQVHPDALGPADERQLIQRGLINRKPGTQLQGQGMTGFAPWLQRQDLLRAPGTQHEAQISGRCRRSGFK